MMPKYVTIFGLCLILSACANMPSTEVVNAFEPKQFQASEGVLHYRVHYPDNFNTTKKYPLVVVLHGAGERGDDNKRQLANGGAFFINQRTSSEPAIVVFPQVPSDQFWAEAEVDTSTRPLGLTFPQSPKPTTPMRKLIELLDNMDDEPYIDRNRIYLFGISMGAMGVYELAAVYPHRFAAAVAICGATAETTAKRIQETTPIWAFHGERDHIISVEHSKNAVEWINTSGGHAKLTLYPKARHNSWDNTFAEPSLLKWLFSHSLTTNTN